MARTNNLTNFLIDVAAAIKEKKGSQTDIPAANFDTEILALPSQGVYQTKSVTISANGTTTVIPDQNYDAIDEISITVQVPEKALQIKSLQVTSNMNIEVEPDTGYDGFSKLALEVNVPSSSGMKQYVSVAAMNADINNIATGEVVKVVSNNITTFYIKEVEIIYQPLDLSLLSVNDTISLYGMKINKEAYSDVDLGTGDINHITFTNNGQDVLDIYFHGGVRSISGSLTINGIDQYDYATAQAGAASILSDADVISINSNSIWSNNTLLTVSTNTPASSGNYIQGAILEPVEQGEMKKLIKEEDTISPEEYIIDDALAEDILGEQEVSL